MSPRARALALLLMKPAELLVGLLSVPLIMLHFTLGMVFLLGPVTRVHRGVTARMRELSERWCGVPIAPPYLPEPPPPVRQPDGWYRKDRSLYRTPFWPRWQARLEWRMSDAGTWRDLVWFLVDPVVGGILALAAVVGGRRVLRWHGLWWRSLLGPTRGQAMRARLRRLAGARAQATDQQAAELRRIERDLHDGAQARLVSMGMTLGAAEDLIDRDPAAAKALLARSRESSAKALAELRDLVRGIHPPVLAERGLADALRALALDSPLDVEVTAELDRRLEASVESAAYFAIAEALTNAARHGGAARAWVDLRLARDSLRIVVTDDGDGGADPARGSGLRGVEKRLAAFDGVLVVNSPEGGPTMLSMDLPTSRPGPERDEIRLTTREKVAIAAGWSLGWLPLFPQGLVPLILKLSGSEDEMGWALAFHTPEPFRSAIIVLMIALGLGLYGMAVSAPILAKRRKLYGGAEG
ncbi:sensor histidine kinase [Bailinhaonella thermotolerans]|uniref:sensor histidine kinase n=1 Tax=Bailinhaonella thermotolerans TaxID=1070861 RepID=UPI001F5B418E|nr:histidine kinase [Bailinhaonella thermotolerans]